MKTVKILILIASFALLAAMLLPGFQRPKNRVLATDVVEQSRMIEAAMGQYAIKYAKQPGDPVTWADVQPFLKPGTALYSSSGIDRLGGVFRISTVGTPPKIADTTFRALSDIAPPDWWSPYR